MKMRLRTPSDEISRQYFKDEFTGVLRDSGYFTMLEWGQEGDLRMDVDLMTYLGNQPMEGSWIVFSGFTVFTIPYWKTQSYKVRVKVTNAEGREYKYVLEDAATAVAWLPMIVVAPFKFPPGRVYSQVLQNMYKELILRMQKDGILPPAQKALQRSGVSLTFEFVPAV